MMRSCIHRRVAIAIVVLPLLLASGLSAYSQKSKELPLRELTQAPGKLIGEAKSARPSGDLQLTGYTVEEVSLPRSLNVEIHGQQVSVNKAWRVTVNGGPFPVRALPAVVWVDDQIVGSGIENDTLSKITAITFDGSVIREGGVVSISYGEDKASRRKFPQALKLNREGGNQ